jgi:hypothetical protein
MQNSSYSNISVEADPGILARVRNKSLFSLFDFNYEK